MPHIPRATHFVAATCLALACAVILVGCSQASRLNARCLGGDLAVCTQLGDMYAAGKGVERNMGRAAQLYERACAGGVADVCNTLGEIYEKSGTIEGGLPRAQEFYAKACDGGSSAGCLNLGLVFAAREDYAQAFSLYERSCGGGWSPGCYQLAGCYERGEGTVKDVGKALAVYSQACDGDHVESCLAAGNLYAAGDVVAKDLVLALKFYTRAEKVYGDGCDGGNQNDCTERDRIRTRMMILSAGAQPAPPAVKK